MFLLRLGIFLAFLALIYLSQRFWFVGSWQWIGAIQRSNLKNGFQILWFVALLTVLAGFLDPMLGHALSKIAGGKWITAATRIWLVASFFGFFAVKLVGIVGWISGAGATLISSRHAAFDPARRNFFRYAAYLAGSVPFVAATYGFATGRLKYRVERVDVPLEGLPKELDGMKIVQLSDIHIGDFMPREEVRRAVQMANGLNADLAVVTGDFVSSEYDPLEDCITELSRLRAPLGTWGCNGNHEIYADAEDSAQQLFEQHGMKLLRQENIALEHQGGRFNLIGVDYQRDHMTRGPRGPMLQHIEHLVSREMPNILLSHNPNSFHRAAELGIELSLAGHTHGGQVKVEIVEHSINPARLITDFVAGLYHLPIGNHNSSNGNGRKAFLYVNRGLGTFGMPVRLGVPPEITLLTLRAA
ncbi:MAG TPA: metallophosphoesterase [Terriglobales bacterium]|nr:metallophosphoesterase [Terriglobales bacterium]